MGLVVWSTNCWGYVNDSRFVGVLYLSSGILILAQRQPVALSGKSQGGPQNLLGLLEFSAVRPVPVARARPGGSGCQSQWFAHAVSTGTDLL